MEISNEDKLQLKKQGWYPSATKTLFYKTKEELINYARCLEHNWAGEIWGNELLRARLKNACDYIKSTGVSLEELNKIISVKGERI